MLYESRRVSYDVTIGSNMNTRDWICHLVHQSRTYCTKFKNQNILRLILWKTQPKQDAENEVQNLWIEEDLFRSKIVNRKYNKKPK